MAKMYITEFGGMPAGGLSMAQAPNIVATYTVAVSSVAVISTQAIDSATTMVRLHTDAICSFQFVPTTSTTMESTAARMAANATEYFGVKTGLHVAVITNS